jgi:prolyl oligopeptidase PreP (S9A serine peptidase family)
VNRDGGNPVRLNENNDTAATEVHTLFVVQTLPGDTTDFIGQEYAFDSHRSYPGRLVRVDSRTGRRTPIALPKPAAGEQERWVVDAHGVARALIVGSRASAEIWYRAGADAPWRKLDEFPALSPAWEPLAVADDDKTLIVAAYHGQDKAAIMRYDPEKKAFGEVMARHPQIDLEHVIIDEGRVVGVSYQADRGGTAMFEDDLARVQNMVDKTFPDAVNRLSWTRDRSKFIVFSYSDVSPGAFYLLDAKSRKLQWLADVEPWIDPKAMAPMKAVRYKARDGLEIPAFLTLPKGSDGKNLPLVMVIHGGPYVDGDRWGYDPEVQFLASRGYAVLQPNYRGTMHYGWKHFSGGFKTWGLAMEEDIEDGVHWAVAQGIADPKRVAIYGASYGGYATMMGLAKTPDLYRCGINYVGVTDLPLLMTATWSDTARGDYQEYLAPLQIGDLDKDAKQLRDTSPVNLASRIKVPVLMAYGAADVRVVLDHGTRMKSALDRAGVKNEWMVMSGEGHGFRDLENQKAFYGAMEKFLAQNMK